MPAELRVCEACDAIRPGGTTCPGCGGGLSLRDLGHLEGRRLGRYRVRRLLGAGGMGAVYEAEHDTLGSLVAVKVILPQLAAGDLRRRFVREARILARLRHPGIVAVHDFEAPADGLPWLAMEYLEGASLREVAQRRGRIDRGAVGTIVRQVAGALAHAHRQDVVHRDLKPENVFLATYEDETVVKVLDFGIAKVVDRTGGETVLTATGEVFGTPDYLAPEQILSGRIGPWTDVYTLALMTVELLTGRSPRAGKTPARILAESPQERFDPSAWPDLGLAEFARDVLVRALEPKVSDRLATVGELVDGLGLEEGPLPPVVGGGRTVRLETDPLESRPTLDHSSGGSRADADLGATIRRPSAPTPAPPARTEVPRGAVLEAGPAATRALSETSAATARGRKRSSALHRLAGGLLGFAILVGVFWLVDRVRTVLEPGPAARAPASEGSGTETEGASPAEGAGSRPVREIERRDVPLGATRILGWKGDVLLVADARSVHRVPGAGRVAPPPLVLREGESVLGLDAEGDLVLRSADVVRIVDALEGRERDWLVGLPVDGAAAMDPDGRFLAFEREDGVRLVSTAGGRARTTADWRDEEVGAEPEGWRILHWRWAGGLLGLHVGVDDAGSRVLLLRGADGTVAAERPLRDAGARSMAVETAGRWLVAGGRSDRLEVLFADGSTRSVASPGPAAALVATPDGTLWIGGPRGLARWEPGLETAEEVPGIPALVDLRFVGGRLVGITTGNVAVSWSLGAPAPLPWTRVEGEALGGLAVAPDGSELALSMWSGPLAVLDAETGDARVPEGAEGDGPPQRALALSGAWLVAASDDRRLSVWRRPELRLELRAPAHDYLINDLGISGDGARLWTSSSDGTVRSWQLPGGRELERIDVRALSGREVYLASLWVDATEETIVVSSWNNEVFLVEGSPGNRRLGARFPMTPRAALGIVEVPEADALVLALTHRFTAVGVLDLVARSLDVRSGGIEVLGAVADPTREPGDPVRLVGRGGLVEVVVTRGSDGGLGVALEPRLGTDLGVLVGGARVGDELVVADEAGVLYRWPVGGE